MGRLIDADALMEYTRNQKSRTIDCNDIARFPTAYNVEKVIEQLEERTDLAKNFFTTSKVIHINTVRKYIRNGGKE